VKVSSNGERERGERGEEEEDSTYIHMIASACRLRRVPKNAPMKPTVKGGEEEGRGLASSSISKSRKDGDAPSPPKTGIAEEMM
jgi:hypothetical protein